MSPRAFAILLAIIETLVAALAARGLIEPEEILDLIAAARTEQRR